LRGLYAVIHAVAHEVHQAIADLLEHGLVELGLLAGHLQLDLLAEPLSQVADHARKRLKVKLMGNYASTPHHAFLQLAHVAL